MRLWISLAILLLGAPSVAAAEDRCGTYPDAVFDQADAGWGDCLLHDLGEAPLWHGLEPNLRQHIRFTFTEGHGLWTRVVNIIEYADGGARVSLRSVLTGPRDHKRQLPPQSATVTAAQIATLNQLAEQSGVWKFDVGSWNNPKDLVIHCEMLDMERANADGYRFSTVWISCSKPAKLVPLVTFVAQLAGLHEMPDGRY